MIVDNSEELIIKNLNCILKNILNNTILNNDIFKHIYSFILPCNNHNYKSIQILYIIQDLYLSKYNINYTVFIDKFIKCMFIKKKYFKDKNLSPYKKNDIYYFKKGISSKYTKHIEQLNYLQLYIFIYQYYHNCYTYNLFINSFDSKFYNFINNYFNNFIYI